MYILFDGNQLHGIRARYDIYDNLKQVRDHIMNLGVRDLEKYLEKVSVHPLGEKVDIQLNGVPFKGLTGG